MTMYLRNQKYKRRTNRIPAEQNGSLSALWHRNYCGKGRWAAFFIYLRVFQYRPLAKVEELEEQNYNMIDDRLNNGVEKFNREEEKKEQQEKPQARSSLKERLAAKQKEVAQGNNKDTKELEKSKNSHREM